MALSVTNVGSYPAFGGATQTIAGLTFTSNVYTPGSTTYVAGYIDGENRAKLFYTDGSTVALPTLTNITRTSQIDAAGTTKTGSYYVTLAYSAGSPDATSANSQIYLDQFAILITSTAQYGA